jgi:hypothetical protein
MSPRFREFLMAQPIGGAVGLTIMGLRYGPLDWSTHLAFCGALTGIVAALLLAPHPGAILLSVIGIPVSYRYEPQASFVAYAFFVLSTTHLTWAVFEYWRFARRLKTDPGYRERFARHVNRSSRGGGSHFG